MCDNRLYYANKQTNIAIHCVVLVPRDLPLKSYISKHMYCELNLQHVRDKVVLPRVYMYMYMIKLHVLKIQ